jgi:hypothetical protein
MDEPLERGHDIDHRDSGRETECGGRGTETIEALAKPLCGVCKREVRIQNTGVRITEHVARERVPILNSEFWLLNTALAEPTKEVLQAPP